MKIRKVIELSINIDDAITFCYDYENNIMKLLKDNFTNKCLRSVYINDILRIVRISEPIIYHEVDNIYAVINVQFEAEATVFNKGDIIVGCEVIGKDNTGTILARTDFAFVGLRADPLLNSVQKGQLIPAIVGEASYPPGEKRIAIKALPFVSVRTKAKTYYINFNDISEFEWYQINCVFEELEREEKKVEEIVEKSPSIWNFFDSLFYSYDDTKMKEKVPNGGIVRSIRLKNNEKSKLSGWFSRDPLLDLTDDKMIYYRKPTKDLEVNSNINSFDGYLAIIYDYMDYIRFIRNMTEIYNDESIITKYKNIWQIFKKSKLK